MEMARLLQEIAVGAPAGPPPDENQGDLLTGGSKVH
jgi:hypothetical protein